MNTMNGVDISHWQKGINLDALPCDFVIVKATQGTNFIDPNFLEFSDKILSLNKKLGVYHYFGGNDPVEEADFFLRKVNDYIGKAILILDWEKDMNPSFTVGPKVALQFLNRVYNMTGIKPMIYMSKSVCREYDWSEVVNRDYGLWMAQYANKKRTGYQEKPWTDKKGMGAFKTAAIHQYSSTGFLEGYNKDLDLDIAYMTPDAWDLYVGSNVYVKPIEYYPKYQETLNKVLDIMDINNSFSNRSLIASANGINNYEGIAEQNIRMLELLKEGKLIKP